MDFVCSECGKRVSTCTMQPKCECGGLWDLDFVPTRFSPEDIDRDEWSIFRYRKFMALSGEAWRQVSLGEGMTPVISLNQNVLLKMDYFMPTLSYKDRGAAVLMVHCKELGVKQVVQDSSGNAGNSIAAYAARAGIGCKIFVPEGTSIYEVWEQLHRIPRNLVIPVGNGTLFLGAMLALEHLLESGVISQMPQIWAVQSEHCDPLLQGAERGEKDPAQVMSKPTLAEGIAIGVPMRGRERRLAARSFFAA